MVQGGKRTFMKVNRPNHNQGPIQHATIGRHTQSDKIINQLFKKGYPKPHKTTFKFDHHQITAQTPKSSELPKPKKNKRT
jgi:hypothetical protein